MGRREDRQAIQSTWNVLEPRVPGTPFRKKDIEDANELAAAREAEAAANAPTITREEARAEYARILRPMYPQATPMRRLTGRQRSR